MDDFLDFIKLIGGILGIITFIWKINDLYKSYLQIFIEFDEDSTGEMSLKTTIINKSNKAKNIKNAFIIVSPEDSSVIDVANKIISFYEKDKKSTKEFRYTNEFEKLKFATTAYVNNEIIYIPLSFYFSENVHIGDENLTYRTSLEKMKLNDGIYSARFFIFHDNRYHRSSQDLFRVKNNLNN